MTVTPSTKVREVGSQKPARRRIGRPLSAAHIVIAVVVILAFVLNLLVLQDRGATTLVAIADEPLAAGSTLNADDLSLVPVDSDFEGLPELVTEDELGQLDGWVLSRGIPAGGLLDTSALIEGGSDSGLRSMSLPVPIEHAAGGTLVAGDRVDVISVVDTTARFVATDLEVLSVSESSSAIGSISAYHIVVSVEADEALDLARALDGGSVEIVRSTGAEDIGQRTGDDP
ncbi:MAG TPA: SAF domain-containing protein [Acidimicrobiia bacterium]